MPKKKSLTGWKPDRGENGRCAGCNTPGSQTKKLSACSRCGMVAYCDKECQRAAWKEHKGVCNLAVSIHSADDIEGGRTLFFSRVMGATLSMLLHREKRLHGRGIISAVCSHKLSEYCGPKHTSDKRSVTLTYIPEGDALRAFEDTALGPTQPKTFGEDMGSLAVAMHCADQMEKTCSAQTGELLDGRFCIVGLQSAHTKYVSSMIFFSYLSKTHLAHREFDVLCTGSSLTIDWDWDNDIQAEGGKLQWLLNNAVDPKFYRECSLAWQEKLRTKDASPWPQGVLTPPLGMTVNFDKIPEGSS
eukprot:gene3873-13937_t